MDTAILQRVTWIWAMTLITIAVFLQNLIGIDWSAILVVPGIVMLISYFTSKGMTRQRPKYTAAKGNLLVAIGIISVGGAVVELSEIPAILFPAKSSNITLMALGITVMIGGMMVFIISLVLADSDKPIA